MVMTSWRNGLLELTRLVVLVSIYHCDPKNMFKKQWLTRTIPFISAVISILTSQHVRLWSASKHACFCGTAKPNKQASPVVIYLAWYTHVGSMIVYGFIQELFVYRNGIVQLTHPFWRKVLFQNGHCTLRWDFHALGLCQKLISSFLRCEQLQSKRPIG